MPVRVAQSLPAVVLAMLRRLSCAARARALAHAYQRGLVVASCGFLDVCLLMQSIGLSFLQDNAGLCAVGRPGVGLGLIDFSVSSFKGAR